MQDSGMNETVRILVIGQVPPPYHGSNVMTQNLLQALDRLGHTVYFVNKSFSREMSEVRKISFRKFLRIPPLVFILLQTIIRYRPNMCVYFIANSPGAFVADAFLIRLIRIFDIPYILRFGAKGFQKLSIRNIFLRYLVSTTFKGSLGGIVKSDNLKPDVNDFISDNRLISVPNCVCDTVFLSNQREGSSVIQVLFLSNLMPAKGPMQFLKAASRVIEKTSNVHFVLAGTMWREDFYKELVSYIEQNGLKEFVSLPGGVYGREKYELFSSSHIFVFPTHNETFGIVILEAMRACLPVIASAEGAIPETVQDGITGYIINPHDPIEIADRIQTLIDDDKLRHRMGSRGYERFKTKYTIEAYARNWEGVLDFFNKSRDL